MMRGFGENGGIAITDIAAPPEGGAGLPWHDAGPVASSSNALLVLIDRRRLIRDSLARSLRAVCPNEAIVDFATTEEWLASGGRQCPPSLVLLGCGEHAARADLEPQLRTLRQSAEAVEIALISDREDAAFIFDAMEIGARGIIPTSLGMEVAINAIRLILAGGAFVPAAALVASKTMERHSTEADTPRIFTERQTAVIEALRLGKPNKIIAYELSMCESTVKVHVRNIMKRLKATNRTQVAYLYHSLLSSNPYARDASFGQGLT